NEDVSARVASSTSNSDVRRQTSDRSRQIGDLSQVVAPPWSSLTLVRSSLIVGFRSSCSPKVVPVTPGLSLRSEDAGCLRSLTEVGRRLKEKGCEVVPSLGYRTPNRRADPRCCSRHASIVVKSTPTLGVYHAGELRPVMLRCGCPIHADVIRVADETIVV